MKKVISLMLILIVSLISCKTEIPDYDLPAPEILPSEPTYPSEMQWEAKDGGYWIPPVDFTRLRKWREDVEKWFRKYYTIYPRADPGID